MVERFLGERVVVHAGDCREVLAGLDPDSFDAAVTDPPYHLSFMGQRWDRGDVAFTPELWRLVYRVLKPGAHVAAFCIPRHVGLLQTAMLQAGFEFRECVVWAFSTGFPKNHDISRRLDDHRCKCSAEGDDSVRTLRQRAVNPASVDAQTEPETILLQSKLPRASGIGTKSDQACVQGAVLLDGREHCVVSPEHERAAESGVEGRRDVSETPRQLREREICSLSTEPHLNGARGRLRDGASPSDGFVDWPAADADRMCSPSRSSTAEQSENESGIVALQSEPQERGAWPRCRGCGKPIIPDGIGTALKPATELIVLARKPLSENSVAANVLRWGTGGLNIDACRIPVVEAEGRPARVAGAPRPNANAATSYDMGSGFIAGTTTQGRWPANLIHDGSDEVIACFPDSTSGWGTAGSGVSHIYGEFERKSQGEPIGYGDCGSAARFFYSPKADADDRIGSKHPTVKPLDLIQYLTRLVCPPGGVCLDPFAGTGTLGEAAFREGMRAVLIEREDEYLADIRRRMALAVAGPDERMRESVKARQLPRDDGPLFADRPALLPGCDLWPGCGCGTQSGPHTCEGRVLARGGGV